MARRVIIVAAFMIGDKCTAAASCAPDMPTLPGPANLGLITQNGNLFILRATTILHLDLRPFSTAFLYCIGE